MADVKPVWEYKIEHAETYFDTHKTNARVIISNWLDDHARQGWELVSVVPFPPDGVLAYYFRRPKQADRIPEGRHF